MTTTLTRAGLACLLTAAVLSVVPDTATAAHQATCQGVPATLVGTDGDDDLVGRSGNDVIVAGLGDDKVNGGPGDDIVCGGEGGDDLKGGEGDDRLYGERDGKAKDGSRGDLLSGGPGDDLLDPGRDPRVSHRMLSDWVSFRRAGAGVRVDLRAGTASGEGTDELVVVDSLHVEGSDFDDVLLGSDGGEYLTARHGNDVVRGRGGDDTITSRSDELQGESDPGDEFAGGPGNDGILGGSAHDHLSGGRGRDWLAGTHDLRGGPGRDAITLVGESVRLHGGAGNDLIHVEVARDTPRQRVWGGSGRDLIDWSVRLQGVTVDRVRGAIDVPARTASIRIGRHVVDLVVDGFETYQLPSGHWSFRGGPGPEVVWGGRAKPRSSSLTARLGGGDDEVGGTDGDDDLRGGPGHDQVRPSQGTDRCSGFEVGAGYCAG